jgi:ABC-type uncharacterized transport system permease subunit
MDGNQDRRAFLRWLVVAAVSGAAFAALAGTGFVSMVWEKDASYISALTALFFAVVSAFMGHATWVASATTPLCFIKLPVIRAVSKSELEEMREREEVGWFCSELCLALGMLGTIIGFCMMLTGFETLDVKDASSIQAILGDLGKSMATALYTTLVGLSCGCLLKIQCFNLGQEIKSKLGDEPGEGK